MNLLQKPSFYLSIFFILCTSVLSYGQSSNIKVLERKIKITTGTQKVDLMLDLFDLYFTKGSKEQRAANKDKITTLGEDMVVKAKKFKYRKAEILSYKKLAEMYKYYKVPNLYIKYNLKYKKDRNELDRLEQAEIAEIKRQKSIKEAEIKLLEQDKNANKKLIELKKAELNNTKNAFDKSMSKIVEKNYVISQKEGLIVESHTRIKIAQDSIIQQNRINQTLEYEKKILMDEKRIIELSEKASKSRNWMFILSGIIALTIAGFLGILILSMRKNAGRLKEKNLVIAKEKLRSDELLLNILPLEMANELKENGFAKAQSFDNVTVFFSDFKDFTKISKQLSPSDLVKEIDICFKAFDKIIENYDIEKIKTVGDAYICVGGLDKSKEHNPQDVIDAAIEIRNFVLDRITLLTKAKKVFFEVRIGIHTGPIVAGIVGFKKFAYDIWGDTVNTAARMEENSETGKINVSSATFELVKEKYTFTYRGKILAKNKGEMDMYFIHERVKKEIPSVLA